MTFGEPAISRRRFIAGGLATLGATTLPGLLRSETRKEGDEAIFKVGAQSYTFRHFDTEQALKRMHDLGLHYVELYQKHAPSSATAEQNQALLKLCKEYEITPAAWGVQQFSKDHDDNRKYFEFAKALGLKMLSADPDPDSFDSLDKLCEEYKIAIGIHPHGPAGGGRLHRWFSAEVILKAVKDHHPLIGSCLDTGHLIRSAQLGKKLDPAQQIRLMGARNFGVHLKDHDNERKVDVIFGKGALDVPEVLKALHEVKFTGTISIEYEANEDNPSPDVKECVQVVRDAAKKIA